MSKQNRIKEDIVQTENEFLQSIFRGLRDSDSREVFTTQELRIKSKKNRTRKQQNN